MKDTLAWLAGIALLALVVLVAVVAVIAPATAKGGISSKAMVITATPRPLTLGGQAIIDDCIDQATTDDQDWLCPAVYEFKNADKGVRYVATFVLFNSADEPTEFIAEVNESNSPREGFTSAGSKELKWITPNSTEVTLQPKESKPFEFYLEIPKNTKPPSNWEFLIRTKRVDGGMIQTALNLRVVVTMRE